MIRTLLFDKNSIWPRPHSLLYREILRLALREDLGTGDITTEATLLEDQVGHAVIFSKQEAVVACTFVAADVFHLVNPGLEVTVVAQEGQLVKEGDSLMEIEGPVSSILVAERTALNFLQHLCGVATQARRYAKEVEGLSCRVVDTRKTIPGMRVLEKYAVRIGGCHNHRMDLSSGILIKDNHIKACESISTAIERARERIPHGLKIQVEVSSIEELRQAISCGADAVLLDNMDLKQIQEAVSLVKRLSPQMLLEASGGITVENLRSVASTGVDIVSCGALTHSVKAVDLSLRLL